MFDIGIASDEIDVRLARLGDGETRRSCRASRNAAFMSSSAHSSTHAPWSHGVLGADHFRAQLGWQAGDFPYDITFGQPHRFAGHAQLDAHVTAVDRQPRAKR